MTGLNYSQKDKLAQASAELVRTNGILLDLGNDKDAIISLARTALINYFNVALEIGDDNAKAVTFITMYADMMLKAMGLTYDLKTVCSMNELSAEKESEFGERMKANMIALDSAKFQAEWLKTITELATKGKE